MEWRQTGGGQILGRNFSTLIVAYEIVVPSVDEKTQSLWKCHTIVAP
jgi:hypothetical protein